MILSKIKQLKNITITNSQRVIVKCDDCEKEWNSALRNQINGYIKYSKDLCRSCKCKLDYKEGRRNSDILIKYNKSLTNKTLEEILGKEKAILTKQKNSKANSGKNNANFGGKYSHGFGNEEWKNKFKGKTVEEIWGEKKGKELRKHYSESRKGKNNNMYGKPSPQGSGNGWTGWYNGWLFRSLKELSYMIYVIERFNLKWENAEIKKYTIEYIDHEGNKRTYRPDFFIENKFLVEIKPKNLWNSDGVKRKKEAAIKFCNEHNFIYKLTECAKQITFEEIKRLIEEEKLLFIDKYQKKFNNYVNN
jgi:hypothetical protein